MPFVKVDPGRYILFAVLLFLIPLPWVVAWTCAVCFHEICHLVAVKAFGGKICKFFVGLGGAELECAELTDKAYAYSVLAGPVGGLILALLGRWFPRIAICSWLLSAYNLLPISPLDGGQVVRTIFGIKILCIIERIALVALTAIALYMYIIANFGLLPLIIVGSLWFKNRKRPCKESHYGVQ